jgi:hypothetical protein
MGFRLLLGALAILIIVIVFSLGRGCGSCDGCSHPVLPPVGIDAGPGEAIINDRLAETTRQTQAEIDKIRSAHDAEIAAFTAAQQNEFHEVQAQGPEALSNWFSDFNRSLKDAGPK